MRWQIDSVLESAYEPEEQPRTAPARHSPLAEIQHRVRNHFQIVASLLNLQASRTADAATAEMLRAMQNRVRAIANLHDSSWYFDLHARRWVRAFEIGA